VKARRTGAGILSLAALSSFESRSGSRTGSAATLNAPRTSRLIASR
jgi:hypothetical protein